MPNREARKASGKKTRKGEKSKKRGSGFLATSAMPV